MTGLALFMFVFHSNAIAETAVLRCAEGATRVIGAPDTAVLARRTSQGVRAFWCETYDEVGTATRNGPYREFYSNGRVRVTGTYVQSQLEGPLTILHENGRLFLRGFLAKGAWSGDFEIFHETGTTWLAAHFKAGQLQGALRTRYPDGALESETHYQAGREDGLARSFYPTAAGGRLRSEARVEADQIVGEHRILNREGGLLRAIDWNAGPPLWRATKQEPAAPDAVDRAKLDLRD